MEIEVPLRGRTPMSIKDQVMSSSQFAAELCTDLGRRVLLTAPGGSGKTVFSKAVMRFAHQAGVSALRVPIAELAALVEEGAPSSQLLATWQIVSSLHDS